MKTVIKSIVISSLLAALAVPAVAADINKGSKSYQSRSVQKEDQADVPADQAALQDDAAAAKLENIAPAAGAEEDAPVSTKKKSLTEEIRLPRKN